MIQCSVGRVCECCLADGSGCSNADVVNMMMQGLLFGEHVTHPTTHKSLYTTMPVPLGCCSHVAQLEHVIPPNTVYRNCHRLQMRETAPLCQTTLSCSQWLMAICMQRALAITCKHALTKLCWQGRPAHNPLHDWRCPHCLWRAWLPCISRTSWV